MLTLVTSNPAKYAPFAADLERMRVVLEAPARPLPEIQSLNFAETLAAKAQAAAEMFGRPVIVDDSGLVLDAYASFPGPLTATVIRSLGVPGLRRLLSGVSDRAVMQCHLGCWVNGSLRGWTGSVNGRIDLTRAHRDDRMPLSDLFVPDASEFQRATAQPPSPSTSTSPTSSPALLHRFFALAALKTDLFRLHLETAPFPADARLSCARGTPGTQYDCPFCAEIEGDSRNLFRQLIGDRLSSRVVYEDEHFIVMPPMGQFMEGGLLILTRDHILSMAHLPPERFDHLQRLLAAIERALVKHWGAAPLFFEHGPAPDWSKGACCVDHAHINVFPARVHVHPHLSDRPWFPAKSLTDLVQLRRAEFGYLFVQENDGSRRIYDGHGVPTQLVRRVITSQLGMPDRWHWRDYLGADELIATFRALKGQIKFPA